LAKTYAVDGNNVDKTDYLEKHKSQKIAHVYESFQSLESVKDTFSSDTKTPSLIFNYKSIVRSFSSDYVEEYFFTPTFIDLYINEYKNLFLSLGTKHSGEMSTTVYTKSTGYRLTQFFEKNYRGNYLIGNLVSEMDSVDDARVVVVVGDSIFIQDFTKEQLLGDTTSNTKGDELIDYN